MGKTFSSKSFLTVIGLVVLLTISVSGEESQSGSDGTDIGSGKNDPNVNSESVANNKPPQNSQSVATNKPTKTNQEVVTVTPLTNHTKAVNATGDGGRFQNIMENKGMLMRTFYVILGITSLVIIYFGVKAWRTRRRKNKSRKYGLITTRGADLEMEPLDQNMEEDDDMTVFEVNGRQK